MADRMRVTSLIAIPSRHRRRNRSELRRAHHSRSLSAIAAGDNVSLHAGMVRDGIASVKLGSRKRLEDGFRKRLGYSLPVFALLLERGGRAKRPLNLVATQNCHRPIWP